MYPCIPLIFDDDSWEIYVEDSASALRISRLLRFANNRNVAPVELKFLDASPETRRAIIQQIQRRYPGRVVKV